MTGVPGALPVSSESAPDKIIDLTACQGISWSDYRRRTRREAVMNNNPPLLQEWKTLYEAAAEFRKIESWRWMEDSQVFGVQNPETGEIGYCCVLGSLGELFALVVYLGTEGLQTHLKVQSGEITPGGEDALHSQKCLIATYENKGSLAKEDLQVVRELGLSFKGRRMWPLFRNYQPGYFPWFLTREGARFLRLALQQALVIAPQLKENMDLLTPNNEGLYWVRVPEHREGGLRWKDRWLQPTLVKQEKRVAPPVDELRLRRIKNKTGPRQGFWEVGLSFAPYPVQEKKEERPFYPYIFLCVDGQCGLALGTQVLEPWNLPSAFQQAFLNLLESSGVLPKQVLVNRPEVLDFLEPIAGKIGFELASSKKLAALEEAFDSMYKMMKGGPERRPRS